MKNICRKQLCILLAFCLGLSSTVCGFAEQAQEDIQTDMTVMDFSDDSIYETLGEMPQFTRETEFGYEEKTQSLKFTGETTNWTGFIDLDKVGFTTDWTDYATINIRYYTDNTDYVPPVYLSTYEGWINWQGYVYDLKNNQMSENEGSYKLKTDTYSAKKPNETGWHTVSYNLSEDFQITPTNSTNISLADIPYLFIPTHQLNQYWGGDSAVTVRKLDTDTSNVYIDSIWLEKAPEPTEKPVEPSTETPTEETTEIPTAPPITETTDVIDFGDDVTWLRIGSPAQLTKDTAVGYGEKTQSARITAETTNLTGYFDLKDIGFVTDWSNYETINIRYKTSNTEYVPPVRLTTVKNWATSGSETDGAFKPISGIYTSKRANKADEWTVVSYNLATEFKANNNKGNIKWSNIPYMQIPTWNLKEIWNKDSDVTYVKWNGTDEIYIDSIWLEKKKETPTETPTEQVTETPTEQVTETPTEQVTETPTEQVTETPTEQVTETPTAPPITETTDVIDFGDDVTWLRIGTTAQFGKDTKTGYGNKTQSAKVTGLTGNTSGYFDLAAIGFKTDWSDYKTINIRYKTSNVGYVPPVRLSTIKDWVSSANEDTENAYKPTKADFTSKKATKANEWTVVSYSLENDFAKRSSKNDNISWSNLKYMQIPTNYLHNYWGNNSGIEYKAWNGTDEIYIDSIWLDKTEQETPTETPTIPPKGEYTGPDVEEQGLVASFRNESTINSISQISKNTDKTYIYSDYPMSGKYDMSSGKDSGYYDLKKNKMTTDWSGYKNLNLRFYSTKANVTYGIVASKDAARGAYDSSANPWYYNLVTTAEGWNTVSIPVTGFTKWTTGSMSLSEVNYLQIMLTDTSKGVTGKNDGIIYFDKIWLDNGTEHPEIDSAAFYPENGTKSMPVRGAEIRVKTPQCRLAYVFDLDVQFFKDGQPIDIDFESVLNDDLIISINDILDYDTAYSVKFKLNAVDEYDRAVELDCTYTFNTVREGANASGIKLKSGGEEITALPQSGEVAAEVSLSNSTDTTAVFILNIAAYDKNGTMTAMPVPNTYTLQPGE